MRYSHELDDRVETELKVMQGSQELQDHFKTRYEADTLEEAARRSVRERLKRRARKENERIWALYRLTDWSQHECAAAIVEDDRARPTQSQVSRIIRDIDARILKYSEHLQTYASSLEEAQNRDAGKRHGFFERGEDAYDALPEEVLDSHRDLIADIILRRQALNHFAQPGEPLPEWAEAVLDDDLVEKAPAMRAQYYEEADWLHDDPNLTVQPEVRRRLSEPFKETMEAD